MVSLKTEKGVRQLMQDLFFTSYCAIGQILTLDESREILKNYKEFYESLLSVSRALGIMYEKIRDENEKKSEQNGN